MDRQDEVPAYKAVPERLRALVTVLVCLKAGPWLVGVAYTLLVWAIADSAVGDVFWVVSALFFDELPDADAPGLLIRLGLGAVLLVSHVFLTIRPNHLFLVIVAGIAALIDASLFATALASAPFELWDVIAFGGVFALQAVVFGWAAVLYLEMGKKVVFGHQAESDRHHANPDANPVDQTALWPSATASAQPSSFEPGAIDRFTIGSPGRRLLARGVDGVAWLYVPIAVFWGGPMAYVFAVVVALIYEVFMVATQGATLGKRLVGLKLVREDGGSVDLLAAVTRTLIYVAIASVAFAFHLTGLRVYAALVFLGCVGAGVMSIINDPKQRTSWDRLAKTLVVEEQEPGSGRILSSP